MRSVYLLWLFTEKAWGWVEENVSYGDHQIAGGVGIYVEYRFIGPIVSAMEEAGLRRGEDFSVS